MGKLTKRMVEAAAAEEKEYLVWDTELRGFGLRVYPTGAKKFLVQYRNKNGRTRRLTLGTYGRLTVDEARSEARQRLSEVDRGADPSAERHQRQRSMSVAQLVERFLTEHVEPRRKKATAKEYRRMLEKHALPALGDLPVDELEQADVDRLHRSMAATPYQANRVIAALSAALTMAEKWKLRPRGSNPCLLVEKFRETARERYLTNEELARLGEVLREAEESGAEPPEAILAIRLLLFTGCRKSEILSLKWDFVDFDRGLLLLPDSKTGRKAIPLGAPALDLLAAAPRLAGNPYVLPGRRAGSHFIGLPHAWERLRAQAGLEDVRLHDLRHSHASVGAGVGLSLPIIGRLLGHSQPATTARYAHLADDPLRRAADQVSGEIASALDGRK